MKLRRFLIVHKSQVIHFLNQSRRNKLEANISHHAFLDECIKYINIKLGLSIDDFIAGDIEGQYSAEMQEKIRQTFGDIIDNRVSEKNIRRALAPDTRNE